MKVLKFGGTSVGTPENIRMVADIVKDRASMDKVLVVVSAFSGVTNLLEKIGNEALTNPQLVNESLSLLKARHIDAVNELVTNQAKASILIEWVDELINDLAQIGDGIQLLQEITDKSKARLMSAGELLSSRIIHSYFLEQQMNVQWVDSRKIIQTNRQHLDSVVNIPLSNERFRSLSNDYDVTLIPGFIGANSKGETTTIGRGGSDYTAALAAAALNAELLEIWTDVDGVLSANPKWVDKAISVPSMSYEEAMELSHFGAKVIYPPTIQPVLDQGIPIAIKNTFNPAADGTLIERVSANKHVITGFSSISDLALITLSGSGMIGVPGIAMRLFRAISSANLNVLFITQSSSEHTITVGLKEDFVKKAKKAIEEEFALEKERHQIDPLLIEEGLSLIAAVGENMKEKPGIAGKIFNFLGENGINVRAIAQGSTERNISFVVKDEDAEKAVNVLHEGFFLSDTKVFHLFLVGVGNVGAAMLQQLKEQQDYIKTVHSIELRLAGIANSKKMAFDPAGLDPGKWNELLESSTIPFAGKELVERINGLNLRNAIFVDNTASEVISELYLSLLSNNIHVVASNKIAAADTLENYKWLTHTALDRNVKFLFETNVGAGLPIIKTISEMKLTGDRIHKIQAVLSGSLNFIFNHLSKECSFSKAVEMAREKGFTEPDPAIDLSGKDVARKILILARESGYEMEMDEIENDGFIPAEKLKSTGWDDLKMKLQLMDDEIEAKRRKVEQQELKWRYMAELNKGKASVGVIEIDSTHPAYELGGTDNMVLIYSDRYPDNPLVIRGAGAGPQVTASGVMADVMRIANI